MRACEAAGIVFIGPPASAMDAMGEKTRARANMEKAGVPVVPGSTAPFPTVTEARAYAEKIGFPVMLKAAGGGGGKGMRRVERGAGLRLRLASGAARGAQRLRKRRRLPREVPGQAAPRGDPGVRAIRRAHSSI